MFNEQERYARNMALTEIGPGGQEKIKNARVLVIGSGGLGSPVCFYLAAAGVGTLGIVDFDNVDLSNLNRQIIHFTKDLKRPKVESAVEKLKDLNPLVNLIAHSLKVDQFNITSLVKDYDFVIDATDNFEAKFLINDGCVEMGKPFSHGGVHGFEGQTITVNPKVSACYRCIFTAPPPPGMIPSNAEVGILGAVAGILGSIQAAEAVKVICGIEAPLFNRLLRFDARNMKFRRTDVAPNPGCSACSGLLDKDNNLI